MKKLLSLLCAFLMIFVCVGCNKKDIPSESSSSRIIDAAEGHLYTQVIKESDTTACIRIIPRNDITDLVIIIKSYYYWYALEQKFERLLESRVESLGDVVQGQQYIINYVLPKNSFTENSIISEIIIEVKSGKITR